jgi:tagatose-1,6-bisphosphate aldolase
LSGEIFAEPVPFANKGYDTTEGFADEESKDSAPMKESEDSGVNVIKVEQLPLGGTSAGISGVPQELSSRLKALPDTTARKLINPEVPDELLTKNLNRATRTNRGVWN